MNEAKKIGRRLRELRRKAGLSMRELAERCEIHLTAVSHIEAGRREPRIGLLKKIAQSLGCTLDDFVDVKITLED